MMLTTFLSSSIFMPSSLALSSCYPPSFLCNKSSKTNHFNINGYHFFQPKHFAVTIVINPSSKTPNSSIAIKQPFNWSNNFRIQSFCFAVKSSSLSLQDIEVKTPENNSKAKVMQLADKIRATPFEERSKVVKFMIEEQCESKSVDNFNDLIMGLVVVEEFDLALTLFDEMSSLYGLSPDCWTYSILIRCYCKKNLAEEGKRVLNCMIENGFRPNVVTVTILVNSLCSRGKVQRAIEVLEMMGEFGCKPNVQTYNCILKGLCFVGRVEEAYAMLMDLKRKRDDAEKTDLIPDIYSYSAVMDGFCKVGRSDEAMELLQEAIGMGLTPNAVTYNALFNGYCKEGNPRKGIQLLKQMKDRGCVPDYISYSTLLHGLLKWGYFMAAFWVYSEMVEVGLKADERMMNTLLRGLCRKSWEEEEMLKNVYQIFEKMKNWHYSVFPDTYYLVIQTFCIGNEIDMALITLHEMVGNGYFPRMVAINRIIRGLCDEGKINQAVSVLVLVCEAGKFPSKISFNILIEELNKQGNVPGACSIYCSALKRGVIPHKIPVAAVGAQLNRLK